jgi:glycosidase
MLALHRRLLALRRAVPALAVGDYATVHAGPGVLAYRRDAGDERVLVALNLTGEEAALPLGGLGGEIRLATGLDRAGPARGELRLGGGEGVVVALAASAAR